MEKKPSHQISEEVIWMRNPLLQLIKSNLHLPLIREAASLVLATYQVRAIFTAIGVGDIWIWVNYRPLVWRDNKHTDVSFGKNVIYIDGNLNRRSGGSNQYPSIGHEGATCELEFISYGLPEFHSSQYKGWKMQIISIEKL